MVDMQSRSAFSDYLILKSGQRFKCSTFSIAQLTVRRNDVDLGSRLSRPVGARQLDIDEVELTVIDLPDGVRLDKRLYTRLGRIAVELQRGYIDFNNNHEPSKPTALPGPPDRKWTTLPKQYESFYTK
jgi:hypothetical protein